MKALPILALLLLAPFVAAAEESHFNRISLSASAGDMVTNDTMTATLSREAEGKNTAALANTVNGDINWAIAEIKKHAGFKVRTQAYNTHPVYHKSVVIGWKVSQSIRVESRDAAALSQLLGSLQKRLHLTSVSFGVSPELREETENTLISRAIAAFTKRAKNIAADLGHSGYKLVTLNVQTGGGSRVFQARAMMMEAAPAMAPPAMEAGESRLTVTVSGEIELNLNP